MSELNPNNTSQFIIELVREGTVRNFRTVQTEGERKIARVPHSQAGAWERVNFYEESELEGQATCNNFLQVQLADTKDST